MATLAQRVRFARRQRMVRDASERILGQFAYELAVKSALVRSPDGGLLVHRDIENGKVLA